MKRIDSIDFIKGLAILNIILVHTVWWGGYTLINNTSVFKQLPLLFDIPVFFFVTGLLQSYKSFITFKKTVSTFLKQYSLYILIVGIWVLLSLLSYDPPQLANILNAIFLVSFKQSYPVEGIALSIWFFKAYFGIIFFSYFLSKIQHKWIKLLIWLFGLSILYYFRDASDIGLALYYTFFYYIFVFAGKFLWALKFKYVVLPSRSLSWEG